MGGNGLTAPGIPHRAHHCHGCREQRKGGREGPVSYTHLDVYKRQIPSPMSPARCLAASPYKCCSRHSLHWRIRLPAAARIRLYSSLPFIAWPSVESQNRSRNMPACELATACRTRERSSLQGNGPGGQVNRVQQTFFGRHQKSTVCPGEDIIMRLPAMDTCWPGLTGRTSKALASMSVMMLIGDLSLIHI